jgi:hypothetical protein
MPGVNDTVPTQINPGLLASSNLVAPAAPIVSPNAVQAMTDSMRSGAITAQDVIDRVGELGKTRRKAEIEFHKRNIADLQNPDLVAARHAVQLAQGQQAGLAGAQAQAAGPMVQPQAELAQTQLAKQTAEAKHGTPGSIDAFTQMFGAVPTLPNGQPDYETAAVKGAQARGGQMWYQFAAERQKPDPAMTQKIPTAGGGEEIIYRNAQGEVITPGSPKWKEYEDIKAKAFPLHSMAPGGSATVSPAAPSAPPEPTPEQRAQLVTQAGVSPTDASTMSAADVQARLAPPKPSVVPRPVTGSYNPETGGIVTQAGEIPKSQEITEQFRKQKSYEAWNASKPFYGSMANTMTQINAIPVADQRAGKVNLNAQDIELISNFVKLYDPNAVIREFKFDKIEHSQPIPDQVRNWMSTVIRSGQLTPEARQELFRTATEAFRAKQQSIIPDLQMAAKRAQDTRLPLEHIMTPEEQQLLSGNVAPSYAPGGGAAAGGAKLIGPVITRPNGQRIQRGADGQYYPAP